MTSQSPWLRTKIAYVIGQFRVLQRVSDSLQFKAILEHLDMYSDLILGLAHDAMMSPIKSKKLEIRLT